MWFRARQAMSCARPPLPCRSQPGRWPTRRTTSLSWPLSRTRWHGLQATTRRLRMTRIFPRRGLRPWLRCPLQPCTPGAASGAARCSSGSPRTSHQQIHDLCPSLQMLGSTPRFTSGRAMPAPWRSTLCSHPPPPDMPRVPVRSSQKSSGMAGRTCRPTCGTLTPVAAARRASPRPTGCLATGCSSLLVRNTRTNIILRLRTR
mmetsp:Transcript_50380/g.113259  ORF Transcript_50380/g.113259 Transcript_50380/m.113259 type:complete len:203 (-) Transcript_50380:1072-1680(-)